MQILWLKCDSNPHTLWQVKIYNKTLLAQLDAKGSLLIEYIDTFCWK